MSTPNPPLGKQATLPLGETTERQAVTWSSVSIRLDKIIDDGSNPRKDYGEHDGTLAALVDSIRQRGMLQPPVVRPVSGVADCEYVIVLGYRRIAAARALGWEYVRCTPMEDCEGLPADYTDEERMIDALVENLQRRELNCIEVAEGVHQLERRGKTQEEIGRWIGRSQGTVSKLSRLLTLPDGVRACLRTGELSQSHGEELLPLLGECFLTGEIETLASRAVEQGLTANGLRNVVREKIERATPKQVTLEEVAEAGYSTPNSGDGSLKDVDYDFEDRIARTLAATKGLDKDPKPTPRDDNGLTRKDSDKEFAAAMAPDPLVPSLSSLPSPVGTPLLPVQAVDATRMLEMEPRHLKMLADISLTSEYLKFRIGEILGDIIERRARELGVLPLEPVAPVTSEVFPVFEEAPVEKPRPLTPSEVGEAQRKKELADQQAAQERKAQRQAEHEARAAQKAKTDVTFRVTYCYPQNGEWQGGGECEVSDGLAASFGSLVEARAFAAEESARNPRFLVHVTIWTEHLERTSDRCAQRGDLWFFRGQSVPGGVSNSIPGEESLAVVGCVLKDLAEGRTEESKAEQAQLEGSALDLFGEAQTTSDLVSDMAGRLV